MTQNFDIYFITENNNTRLLESRYAVEFHLRRNTPTLTFKGNSIFYEDMQLNYSTRYGKHLFIKSLQTGISYPLFRSELKRIIDNCTLEKSKLLGYKWTVRQHGGLFSLKVVI